MRHGTCTALALVVGLSAGGCYGKFALVQKVHAFNGSVTSNKFVHSALLWGLLILPVYGLAGLGDFLIFNTIEVFTGSNPIAQSGGEREIERNGVRYVLRAVGDDEVEVSVEGRVVLRYRLDGEQVVLIGGEGETLGTLPVAGLPGPEGERLALK